MQGIYKTLLIFCVFQKLYSSSKSQGFLFQVENQLWFDNESRTENNIPLASATQSFSHQDRNDQEENRQSNFFDCDDYQTICCNITLAICGCIPCGLFFMEFCKK